MDALKRFAQANFPEINYVNIETVMNGPWKERKATGTVIMDFFSRDARDAALKMAEGKKVLDGDVALELKIERARTRAQRARNWALRKAEELAKIEAQRRGIPGAGRIDFTMPVRKVYVGEELAFEQQRVDLRGSFMEAFNACILPA